MAGDMLADCSGFDWDESNAEKNWQRHQVLPEECEQLFFNRPLVLKQDAGRSKVEIRYYALGRTDSGRFLFVVFTIRKTLIRVISARDMSRKERAVFLSYEEKEEENT